MTCQELHCYLENPLRVEVYMYRETLPPAVSEHLAACADCARLFEEQKSLGIDLGMARDAAPQVPGTLDAAVLANYRRQMARPEGQRRAQGRAFPVAWVRWGIVAAALVTLTAFLFMTTRGTQPTATKKLPLPATQAPVTAVERGPDLAGEQPIKAEASRTEARIERASATPIIASHNPLPAGFAGLMYCDELSCAGAMEVVRVEIPPRAAGSPGAGAAPVTAEVLVGADGIARGIRIVQ